jgi:ribose-phosphate pyrophosphokinase
MAHRPLTLFGLHGSRGLAELVAKRLEVPLAPHEERDFEDGKHKSRPLQDVRGHDVFVLHSLYGDDKESGNDKLCRLLFFCGAAKDAGAAQVTAVVPYLCYARKARRTKQHDPIITRYVAAMFEAVGIDRVIVFEVHNVAAFENAFRCPTWHIESASLMAEHFASLLHAEPVVAVSPDAGGAKRAEQFRQTLEHLTHRDVGSAYTEKFRSSGVVSGELLVGDVHGRTAVIIDDLISTGGTLVRAASACRAAGATQVFAAATNGLFIDGAKELFSTSTLDGIVIANTVPPLRVVADIAAKCLRVLDTSDTIGRAIAMCHDRA